MTDDEVSRFHAGDERLFGQLVSEHSPRLLGAALRLTRDRAAADDLVHDAWVRAYEARRSFAGHGSVLGWLVAVLRTVHLATVRTEARHVRRAVAYAGLARRDVDVDETADALVEGLDADDRHARVIHALAQLGDRQRDVVTLRVLEGLGTAATADRLGIAEGTVKATLAQALNRLRTLMNGTAGACDR